MPKKARTRPKAAQTTLTETEQNKRFDPVAMEAEAKRMVREGTMPSREQMEAALERIRREFAPKILKARERDQREK
ncbi:hypothetical protein [Occallatibacter riparius]|uniref:Uncharacterized protein n=1 Tax=Occallatibacter riparius TaxID=1002689 RepID=A0A9J7BMD4_9BACT|nr:hypothetical protein [Occallatibacter riparius]UWZ83835.1 hypothetical protein MOP44_25150 [Occallatibacter riparius]